MKRERICLISNFFMYVNYIFIERHILIVF